MIQIQMNNILRVFLILFLSMNCHAVETDQLFESGLRAIEKDDFATAVTVLEQAVKADSSKSEYHRWLGRAYGLSAEQASWFKAMKWAKKARISFEKAVEVEPENIEALLDLREFYRQAPSFLGGGKDKADLITEKLKALGHNIEKET